jgi:hypothetical protein
MRRPYRCEYVMMAARSSTPLGRALRLGANAP